MKHNLKTVQPYFEACWNGVKKFEVRKNDRNFAVGDTVFLREYDADSDTYSGRALMVTVQYVLTEYEFIYLGCCVFSFKIEDYLLNYKPTT